VATLRSISALLFVGVLLFPARASTLERRCDVAFENCKSPLVTLIRNEKVGIDVAFWFMEDANLAQELINRWKAGVPVRILVDTRSIDTFQYDAAALPLQMLKDAGIPLRQKVGGGILHWKMMLFTGQNTVEFSGANYSAEAFMFGVKYADYVDEVIYFTDQAGLVNSFKTRFDDVWTTTTGYTNYANVSATLTRNHATYPIDPRMNFVPYQNFRSRAVALFKTEPTRIDAIMFRITDRAYSDQMLAAVRRGVPVRLITEQMQYRDPLRMWHSYNVDRMYAGGVQVKHRGHAGNSHEKLVLLVGQGMTIFGSSNWTSASAESQLEHNLFTTESEWSTYTASHFNRKWNNLGDSPETMPFVPVAGNTPVLKVPANGATNQSTSVTLQWWAGMWTHKYDVYLGTSEGSMTKVLSDRELGPSSSSSDYKKWTVTGLAPGRKYFWRIVSRTMANIANTSSTFSFTVGSGAPPPPLPAGWTSRDIGAVSAAGSASFSGSTWTVTGSGADIWGAADAFHFASRTMTGDGTVTARVATLTNTQAWTKAGVMIRETLTAGSKHATMFVSAGKGLAFQRRVSTGGAMTHTAGSAVAAPHWVRLVRSGNTFSAYTSSNGSSWTLVGTQTISMASTVYVGLAVTSHQNGTLSTASFTNVSTP
jgi:phosphatidylserine/phosphatidylglycerophosphate/cardiolipin synthase-like enzyme/regulation of enolase protein 1 (concanavalin A-like superfamily)